MSVHSGSCTECQRLRPRQCHAESGAFAVPANARGPAFAGAGTFEHALATSAPHRQHITLLSSPFASAMTCSRPSSSKMLPFVLAVNRSDHSSGCCFSSCAKPPQLSDASSLADILTKRSKPLLASSQPLSLDLNPEARLRSRTRTCITRTVVGEEGLRRLVSWSLTPEMLPTASGRADSRVQQQLSRSTRRHSAPSSMLVHPDAPAANSRAATESAEVVTRTFTSDFLQFPGSVTRTSTSSSVCVHAIPGGSIAFPCTPH